MCRPFCGKKGVLWPEGTIDAVSHQQGSPLSQRGLSTGSTAPTGFAATVLIFSLIGSLSVMDVQFNKLSTRLFIFMRKQISKILHFLFSHWLFFCRYLSTLLK